MARADRIKVPMGHILIEDGEGGWEITKSEQVLGPVIGFKVTHETFASLIPFFEAFPEQTVSAAMRWLVERDEVRAVMARRIAHVTKQRRIPRNGD